MAMARARYEEAVWPCVEGLERRELSLGFSFGFGSATSGRAGDEQSQLTNAWKARSRSKAH